MLRRIFPLKVQDYAINRLRFHRFYYMYHYLNSSIYVIGIVMILCKVNPILLHIHKSSKVKKKKYIALLFLIKFSKKSYVRVGKRNSNRL